MQKENVTLQKELNDTRSSLTVARNEVQLLKNSESLHLKENRKMATLLEEERASNFDEQVCYHIRQIWNLLQIMILRLNDTLCLVLYCMYKLDHKNFS